MALLPDLPSLPTIPDFSSLDAPRIASSIFSTGAKDEVATADVYALITGSGKNSPITSIQALNALPDTSLFDKLDGSITADFLARSKDGIKFDESLLTNRLLGAKNEFKLNFGELSESMKNGALLATYKDKAKYVLTSMNEVNSLVKASKINDMKSLGNFVNRYTGTTAFTGTDKGALGGLLGSVVKTSSDLGIGGVFTTLVNTVNDKGIIGRMTRSLLPVVIQNSDSKLLKELTTGASGQLINIFSPGFTQGFSKAFVYKGTNTRSLKSFDEVLSSFNRIDSSWDRLDRGNPGNSATNLRSLLGGSQDFQNLLLTGITYWSTEERNGHTAPTPINPMHALATAYQEVSVGRAVSRDFPKVVLLNSYNNRIPRSNGVARGSRTAKNQSTVNARLLSGSLAALISA